MTQGAIVHPPVSREATWIENGLSSRGVGSPVAVAFFTGNTQRIRAGVPHPATILEQSERRRVTLQTSRYDESSKVDLAIRIAWAVYPLSDGRQVGSRQFEQEPAAPVEIGLSSSPRSDDQVDGLRTRRPPARVYAGLIIGILAPLHLEVDALHSGGQQIMALGETPPDGPGSGFSGSREVSSPNEARDERLVARLARSGGRRRSAPGRHRRPAQPTQQARQGPKGRRRG